MDIGQANHQSKESKNFAKTMDMSEYQSEFEELEKETALEKKLREDKEKFDQFKLDRWRAVQEKLDSVYVVLILKIKIFKFINYFRIF